MQSMLSFKNRRPSNSAIIYFDGSDDEFEESYRQGINAIRQWCYANGKRVTLPRIYGPNLEVFTTPSEGTFYLTLEHKRRHLALSLAGRDLYFMGWRSGHGTFELKPDSQDEHYMREPCVTLHMRKNYSFLSPKREVGNTRISLRALKDAFEILYKCRGKLSDGLKEAVGILAVHICEAARIQGVLNDVSNVSFPKFRKAHTNVDNKRPCICSPNSSYVLSHKLPRGFDGPGFLLAGPQGCQACGSPARKSVRSIYINFRHWLLG